ncbi:ABC transporter permease [Puia sp.]|uniref:ABC transporter permease n=1 Tax=Puia sp. TaxID=2045100 RepID=UPI002F422D86
MLRNYLKIALRSIAKDKMHSLINIAGLAIGMAVALLIGLWIHDEVSYDKNFDHYPRIALVMQNLINNGEVQTWDQMPYPLAEELRSHYGSDFEQVVMGVGFGNPTLTAGDKKIKKNGFVFEPDAPDLFTLTMIKGDRKCLTEPNSIVLSASTAKAFFGDADPLGRIIAVPELPALKVTGVYKDFPRNSSFANLEFMIPWELMRNNWVKNIKDPWRPNFASVYVRLKPNASFAQVSARIRDAKLNKVNDALKKKKPALFLQPMSRWHLYSEFRNGVNTGGAIQYVRMFGIIGFFVLLLACINFMNLSTARSEKRAREVGLRKTIGSLRAQLIFQFFCESLLTVIFAFMIALLFAWLALPFFNGVADKQMSIPWTHPGFWVLCVSFIVLTALVAGSYPAFYLSSFKPVKVLKGTFKAGRFAAIPRKVLVVVQFTISVTLIIGTIIVYRQIQFAKNRPVGYNRNGLISVNADGPVLHDHYNALRDQLLSTGAVTNIAESSSPTTALGGSSSGFSWPGKDPNFSVDFAFVEGSFDYGRTIDWKIKEGRDFSRDFLADTSSVIINEAAVNMMNLKNPVGKIVKSDGQPFTVVGVINNMVITSPYDEARPVIYFLGTGAEGNLILRTSPGLSTAVALAKIAPVIKKFNPEQLFEYRFVDEEYGRKFGNEERVGKLASFFAALAVTISCLGLFGLISFVAEQRKKEIGIRKVLGASVFNVWNLLSKDFVKLVFFSFLISIPLAWLAMSSWLQNYHYRATISVWVFVAAGGGALIITMAVTSFQAIRAALKNPVTSLRSE